MEQLRNKEPEERSIICNPRPNSNFNRKSSEWMNTLKRKTTTKRKSNR